MAKQADIKTYDSLLIIIFISLLMLGLIMVASSSMALAERYYQNAFFHFNRQLLALAIGCFLSVIIIGIPVSILQSQSKIILIIGLLFLAMVYIPGIGKEANGSFRWISLGMFNLQVSELMKLTFIIYLASYLSRKKEMVQSSIQGFLNPMLILTLISILILFEPDLGAALVISASAMGMLLIAGVSLVPFVIMSFTLISLGVALVVFEPYRFIRLVSFTDPWQDPLKSGFQLTQSLMAYGRGDWFGVGLGNSLQKQFYLPEAHTDFILSVIAEEFGVVGVIIIIVTFFLMVYKLFKLALKYMQQKKLFESYLLSGFALWIGFQSFINIGVSMGALPTKGLTLPFISYGGSSLIMMCAMMSIIFRIEYENNTKNPRNLFNYLSQKQKKSLR